MSNKFTARNILNSKGGQAVEVELENDFGLFRASSPSGISTGRQEAKEIGPQKAVENVKKIIAPALEKEDLTDQKKVDEILIELDGTNDKSRLGTNAILPVSIAVCRAGSAAKKTPLWRYLSEIAGLESPLILPRPSFNLIEGGRHSDSGLAFQEFMISPSKTSFQENLISYQEVYQKLKDILAERFKRVELSAEGAWSVPVNSARAALDLILEAFSGKTIEIAIDAAAASFYSDGYYQINGKIISSEELTAIYQYLAERYPIIAIEDPFFEEDFAEFAALKRELGEKVAIFGDDLTVSNIERIKLAQEKEACSGLVLKPNQIGTVSETIEAAKLAKSFGWKIMVANRAGETMDDFIADLAVGIGAEFIKAGALYPKERMAKYSRLAEIEKELLTINININSKIL
ncbi:MAG: enolase C-terminal domain-like protein [bacterium]